MRHDQPVSNPELVSKMSQLFGSVQVTHVGEPLEGYYCQDPERPGSQRLKVVRWGERYLANCPFCGDSRNRLAVSHRCGIRDEQVFWPKDDGFGVWHGSGWELWKCFNEECQKDPENRKKFRTAISTARFDGPLLRATDVAVRNKPTLEPYEFPGLIVPLTELPNGHPALRYLVNRKFDPAELVAKWGIGYAAEVPIRLKESMAQGRISIPVMRDGVVVGYQFRYPDDLDWKAAGVMKYLTYFPKSLTLYGIDEAEGEGILVYCEGVTDVWRYGPGAICSLGKDMSADQVSLLVSRGKTRPLVLVPDCDDPKSEEAFFKSAKALVQAGYQGKIGVAELPPGKDPASMPLRDLRFLVINAAASAESFVTT